MMTGEYLGAGMVGVGVTDGGISSFLFSCVSILGLKLEEGPSVFTIGHIFIGVLFLVFLVWEIGLLEITFLFVVFCDVVGSSDASTL